MQHQAHPLTASDVETVGAVTANLITWDLTTAANSRQNSAFGNCVVTAIATVVGYSTAGSPNLAITRRIEVLFRYVSGVLTAIGTQVITDQKDSGLTGATTSIEVSGNTNLQLKATGIASVTIRWFAFMEVHLGQP